MSAAATRCDHPDDALQQFPGEMGPMLADPVTGFCRARVLSYVWICSGCGTELTTHPRREERSV